MSLVGNTRWDKGIQQMTLGTQKQESGDLIGAQTCYEYGIQMMIDHLKTLPKSDRKQLKQAKVESYMDILAQVKKEIQEKNPNAAKKLQNRIVKPKPKQMQKPKPRSRTNLNNNNNNRSNSNNRNSNINRKYNNNSSNYKNTTNNSIKYTRNRNNSNNNNKNKNNITGRKNRNKSDSELYSRIENEILNVNLNISFNDVIGLSNVKQALLEAVILPAQRPDLFCGPRSPPKGILLFGPPGNGKTFIAKALASECNATFFCISASSLTSRYVGDSEKMVRALFECARDNSPSIIFIDEIDSLLTSRGNDNEQESSRRMKTEFLVQMDGVQSMMTSGNNNDERVLLIGATNLPWQLDDAVLRRFEKRILVPLPDKEQRKYIISSKLGNNSKNGVKHNLKGKDLNEIVNKTNYYSASDLNNLVKDASMGPIRDLGMKVLNTQTKNVPPVNKNHFVNSLDNVKPSANIQSLKKFDQWNQQFGSKLKVNNKGNNDKYNSNKNNNINSNNNNNNNNNHSNGNLNNNNNSHSNDNTDDFKHQSNGNSNGNPKPKPKSKGLWSSFFT